MAGSIKQQILSQHALASIRKFEGAVGAPLTFVYRSAHAQRPTAPRLHKNVTEVDVGDETVRLTRGERKKLARQRADDGVNVLAFGSALRHLHPRRLRHG